MAPLLPTAPSGDGSNAEDKFCILRDVTITVTLAFCLWVLRNFRRKIIFCCREVKPWKHKPFRSHFCFNSLVAAQRLDLASFLPKRNETFHPKAEVILWGKSLQSIIRYKRSMYLRGHNLLNRAVTGHLLQLCSELSLKKTYCRLNSKKKSCKFHIYIYAVCVCVCLWWDVYVHPVIFQS